MIGLSRTGGKLAGEEECDRYILARKNGERTKELKPGDIIVIDGVLHAIIRTVQTPAQIRESLPALSSQFTPREAPRLAVITFVTESDPETATSVIIETPTGWESMEGDPLNITRIEGHKL